MANPYKALGSATGKKLKKKSTSNLTAGVSRGTKRAAPVAAAPRVARPVKQAAKKKDHQRERKLNEAVGRAEVKTAKLITKQRELHAKQVQRASGETLGRVLGGKAPKILRTGQAKPAKSEGLSGLPLAVIRGYQQKGIPRGGLAEAATNVALTTAEHPGKVAVKTLESVPEILAGMPAALVETVTNPKKAVQDTIKDYDYRYSPEGSRAAPLTEGLIPYISDAAMVAAPASGVGRRAITRGIPGTRVKLPKRPPLRVSANVVKKQEYEGGVTRRLLQRNLDKRRAKADVRRAHLIDTGHDVKGSPVRPKTGEVTPLIKNSRLIGERAKREKDVSKARGRSNTRFRLRYDEVARQREKKHSLSKPEQRAAAIVYELGLKPGNIEGNRAILNKRIAQIEAAHAKGAEVPNTRQTARSANNLVELKWLRDHPEAITPEVRKFADETRAIVGRAGALDETLTAATRIERLHSPIGKTLGIERLDGETATAFAGRVRREGKKHGLTAPGYLKHELDFEEGRANRTAGRAVFAKPKAKRTTLSLYERGAYSTRPEQMFKGAEENLKRHHTWNAQADFLEKHSFGTFKTYGELKAWAIKEGVDMQSIALVSPAHFRRLAESGSDPEGALKASAIFPEDVTSVQRQIAAFDTKKFSVVPRDAYDTAAGLMSGGGSGALTKFGKRIPQSIILSSPGWLLTQVMGNPAFAAVAGIGPKALISAKLELRALRKEDPEAWQEVMTHIGTAPYFAETHGPKVNIKRMPGGEWLDTAWDGIKTFPGMTAARHGKTRHLNPLTAILRTGRAVDDAWRQAVFMGKANRLKFERMDAEVGTFGRKIGRVLPRVRVGDPAALKSLLKDKKTLEELAEHTDKILGDYTSYAPWERRMLESWIPFYGFLRFSLRWTFWTMPREHPVMSAIGAKLGQIHENEVRDLLNVGPDDPLPFQALAKVYSADGSEASNLARYNPTGNLLTSAQDPRNLISALPPMAGVLLNQILGRSNYFGQDWQTKGRPEPAPVGLVDWDRVRILTNDIGGWFYPYKLAQSITQQNRKQGAESLFGDRPIIYRDETAKARQDDRVAKFRAEDVGAQIIRNAIPGLAAPSDDIATAKYLGERKAANPPRLGPHGEVLSAPTSSSTDPMEKALQSYRQGGGATTPSTTTDPVEQALQKYRLSQTP